MYQRRMLVVGGLLLASLMLTQPALAGSHPRAQLIVPISVGLSGQGGGSYAAISGDGRFVAFKSPASDLAPNHIDNSWDVFVRDRLTKKMEIASTRTGGAAVYNPGDYTSPPSIASSGKFVAFMSSATDLVPNDENGLPDIFIHDRDANTTELISVAANGAGGNGPSFTPAVTSDGRFVAFQSFANNLTAGDNNDALDIFVRDRKLGVTELISVNDSGQQGVDPAEYGFPGLSISDDGRFVAFAYRNLPVQGSPENGQFTVYLRDRQAHTTQLIAQGNLPSLSGSGRFLVYVSPLSLTVVDNNDGSNVYLLDRKVDQTEQVSIPVTGGSGPSGGDIYSPPSISADGSLVAFETTAALDPTDKNGLSDIYLRDRNQNETVLVSAGMQGNSNGKSHNPAVAGNGSAVAFNSMASNLVPGGTTGQNNVFVYDRSALSTIDGANKIFIPLIEH